MQPRTALALLATLASAAAGCGSGGSGSTAATGVTRATLHRAKGCSDLLSDLKADAIYKLDKQIDLQEMQIRACLAKYPEDQCAFGGGYALAGHGVAEDASGAIPPSTPAPNGGTTADKSATADSYSQTNVQVAGVDEADFVKNDGKYIYLLHGNAFKVLNAWPADQLKELSSIAVEGSPNEMFVADGKVVVYSTVNGTSIYAAANVTPKPTYGGYGGYGYATDVAVAPLPPGSGYNGGPYTPLTKLTVMTLDGATPTVTREVYFEGNYLDARRVGPSVRTVLQGYTYGPQLKSSVYELYPATPNGQNPNYPTTGTAMLAALEQLRAANHATVNATQVGDWLPYTFVKNGTAVNASTVRCEDFYVPTVGSTENGLTQVAALDLANADSTPQESAILGRVDTVYGNADSLYLAARAWVEPPFVWGGPVAVGASGSGSAGSGVASPPASTPPSAPAGSPTPQSVTPRADGSSSVVTYTPNLTHVHKFEFKSQPTFPNYVASGTVVGDVKDQFSLDEKDGLLRIATTESRQYFTADGQYVSDAARPTSINHLFVLGENGAWLDPRGNVGDLALNERIYSVRFIDNRGYIVTFRQVDPLFVVDLANPSAPKVLGELTIPGFSEYMHPLGNDQLLTIGRETTNGRAGGLALQIFDVTDGAHPVQKQKFVYDGSEYGSSDAEYDHKAFTYFADKQLLAFPYWSSSVTSPVGMRSSLELFKVDPAAGFTKIGSIDNSLLVRDMMQASCSLYSPSVRRGLFLENFAFSISYGGVVVKDVNNLDGQLPVLPLAPPQANDGYGPVCTPAKL